MTKMRKRPKTDHHPSNVVIENLRRATNGTFFLLPIHDGTDHVPATRTSVLKERRIISALVGIGAVEIDYLSWAASALALSHDRGFMLDRIPLFAPALVYAPRTTDTQTEMWGDWHSFLVVDHNFLEKHLLDGSLIDLGIHHAHVRIDGINWKNVYADGDETPLVRAGSHEHLPLITTAKISHDVIDFLTAGQHLPVGTDANRFALLATASCEADGKSLC